MDEYTYELEYTSFPTGFVDIQGSSDCCLTLSIANNAEIKQLNANFKKEVEAVFDECHLMRVQLDRLLDKQDYYVLIGTVNDCYQAIPNITRVNLENNLIQDDKGNTYAFDLLMTDNPDEHVYDIVNTIFDLGISEEAGIPNVRI